MSGAPSERAIAAAVAGAVLAGLSGCSYSLFQTAHTEPPGRVSVTAGASYVSNPVIDSQRANDPEISAGVEGALRVGVTPHLDLGLGGFQAEGAALDAKYDVLDHDEALAVGPRVGIGYGFDHSMFMAEAGGIVSYRVVPAFEPYLALTFANYWIGHYDEPPPPAPGWHYAARTGTGDGLLQMNLGFQVQIATRFAVLLEYSHWFVLQDDPGDFYEFVPTNVLGVAIRF